MGYGGSFHRKTLPVPSMSHHCMSCPTKSPHGVVLSLLPFQSDIPFLRQISNEPPSNFRTDNSRVRTDLVPVESNPQNRIDRADDTVPADNGTQQPRRRRNPLRFLVQNRLPKPSTVHGLEDLIEQEQDQTLSCFLWQQSVFYDKARVAVNAWQLRWYTFYSNKIVSSPDRSFQAKAMAFPLFTAVEVDEGHFVVKLSILDDDQPDGKDSNRRKRLTLVKS